MYHSLHSNVGFSEKYGASKPHELGNQFRLQCLRIALLQFKNKQLITVLKNSREAGTLALYDCGVLCDEDYIEGFE